MANTLVEVSAGSIYAAKVRGKHSPNISPWFGNHSHASQVSFLFKRLLARSLTSISPLFWAESSCRGRHCDDPKYAKLLKKAFHILPPLIQTANIFFSVPKSFSSSYQRSIVFLYIHSTRPAFPATYLPNTLILSNMQFQLILALFMAAIAVQAGNPPLSSPQSTPTNPLPSSSTMALPHPLPIRPPPFPHLP